MVDSSAVGVEESSLLHMLDGLGLLGEDWWGKRCSWANLYA